MNIIPNVEYCVSFCVNYESDHNMQSGNRDENRKKLRIDSQQLLSPVNVFSPPPFPVLLLFLNRSENISLFSLILDPFLFSYWKFRPFRFSAFGIQSGKTDGREDGRANLRKGI